MAVFGFGCEDKLVLDLKNVKFITLHLQGNLHVGYVFGGKDSQQLKGPEIIAELRYLLNLLTLCWHFSKKPFPLFLEETGYSEENVLLQEPKAGVSWCSKFIVVITY